MRFTCNFIIIIRLFHVINNNLYILFNYSIVLLFSRVFILSLFSFYNRNPYGHTSHFFIVYN